MLFTVTATTDLSTKGKRVASWIFNNTNASAAIINFRNGSGVGAPLIWTINLPAGSTTPVSASQAYSFPALPMFVNGLTVEVNQGTVVGAVDLV